MTNAEINKTNTRFSLNGFLVGLAICCTLFVTAGIALFSISSTQDMVIELHAMKRGTTILIGALLGFIISIVAALVFEKKSR